VKEGNPAAVIKSQFTPKITFTRSDRYLDTVPERKICILPYQFDQCGSLYDGTPHRQMGPIDKQCRTGTNLINKLRYVRLL